MGVSWKAWIEAGSVNTVAIAFGAAITTLTIGCSMPSARAARAAAARNLGRMATATTTAAAAVRARIVYRSGFMVVCWVDGARAASLGLLELLGDILLGPVADLPSKRGVDDGDKEQRGDRRDHEPADHRAA